jgi:hypothetical protein
MKRLMIVLGILGLILLPTLALASPEQELYLYNDQDSEFVWSEIYPNINIQHTILEHVDMDAEGTISIGDWVSLEGGGAYLVEWVGLVYHLTGCTPDGDELYVYPSRSMDINFRTDNVQEWTVIHPALGYHYHTTGPFDLVIEFDEGFMCNIVFIDVGMSLQILPDPSAEEETWSEVKALY